MSQNGRSTQLESQVISQVQSKMDTEKVFILSKTECAACIQTKDIFEKVYIKTGVTPYILNLDNYSRAHGRIIMKFVVGITGNKMLPQIWVNGKFIGGNNVVHRLHYGGKLVALVESKTNLGKTTVERSVPSRQQPRTHVAPPIRTQFLPKPIKKEEWVEYKNIEVNPVSMQHRPLTYTEVERNQNVLPQKSRYQKLVKVTPAVQQSNSFTHVGNHGLNSMNFTQQFVPSTQLSAQQAVVTSTDERNWLLDQAILNEPAIVILNKTSTRSGVPQNFVVSRVI